MLDYRILGPLEVADDGRVLPLGRGRERALLAALLVRANEVVSTDRLIEALWGERPPPTAAKALQGHVSQLRKLLGEERLVTRAPGYLLRLDGDELDAGRFAGLLEQGRQELAAGRAAAARETLERALELWRGEPLAEFVYEEFARGEIERLEELRLAALEERVQAELALGCYGEAVAELERLVSRHPLRERLRGQLMLALYQSGRHAEALQAYQDLRQALAGELGIEPGERLQQLERAILTRDPALEPPPRAEPATVAERAAELVPALLRRRRVVAAAAGALLLAAAAALAIVLARDDSAPPVVVPNSLVKIDPRTNGIVDVVRVGRLPASSRLRVVTSSSAVSPTRRSRAWMHGRAP